MATNKAPENGVYTLPGGGRFKVSQGDPIPAGGDFVKVTPTAERTDSTGMTTRQAAPDQTVSTGPDTGVEHGTVAVGTEGAGDPERPTDTTENPPVVDTGAAPDVTTDVPATAQPNQAAATAPSDTSPPIPPPSEMAPYVAPNTNQAAPPRGGRAKAK